MSRMRWIAVLLLTVLLFDSTPGSAAPTIGQGGLHDVGRNRILVTQGLTGAVLIAGKQTLFRLYIPTGVDPNRIMRVNYRIRSAGGASRRLTLSGGSQLIFDPTTGGGPSVGVIIPGTMFPTSGIYTLDFSVTDTGGRTELFRVDEQTFQFVPTKDLRLHVSLIIHDGFFNADQTWYADLERSLRRLGSMLPIRDGVSGLNGDTSSGIRYTVSECDGWTRFADCAYGRTRAINAGPGDDIDITVEFRPGFYNTDPPGDPSPGGNSGRPAAPYNDLLRASCVSGNWNGTEMTAACFAQEIGHNFGLEPPASPHFPDPLDFGHSKDEKIGDPLAFDFVRRVPYVDSGSRFLGDVMNNSKGGAFQGVDSVSFNTFDWNFLRDKLMALPSTGSDTHPRSTLCVPINPNPPCPTGVCSGTVVNSCGETVRCSSLCPAGKKCGPRGICENVPCPLDPPICCTKPTLPVCNPRRD